MCTCNPNTERFLAAFEAALRETAMPEFPMRSGSASAAFGMTGGASSRAFQFTSPDDGTKGGWNEIVAATPFDAGWLSFQVAYSAATGYLDVGIGPSGSEVVIVPDIYMPVYSSSTHRAPYMFPLHIPAGSRISVRARNNAFAEMTHMVSLNLFSPGLFTTGAPIVSRYGSTSDFGGTNVDPGATPDTDSNWIQLTPGTAREHNWLILDGKIGDEAPGSNMHWRITLGIGGAGSEVEVGTWHVSQAASLSYVAVGPPFVIPLFVPAGTRIAAKTRASSGTNNDRDCWLSVYGC